MPACLQSSEQYKWYNLTESQGHLPKLKLRSALQPAPPLKYIPSSRAHTGLQISHVVLLLGGAWRCSAGSTSIPARSFTTVYVRPWFCFWVDFLLMHLTLSCPAAAFTDLDDTLGQMLEKLPPTEQRPTPGCRACRNPAHGHRCGASAEPHWGSPGCHSFTAQNTVPPKQSTARGAARSEGRTTVHGMMVRLRFYKQTICHDQHTEMKCRKWYFFGPHRTNGGGLVVV